MNELWSLGGCLVTLLSAGVVGFGIWRAWSPTMRAYVKTMIPLPAAVPIPVPEPVPGTGSPQPEPAAELDISTAHLGDHALIILLTMQKKEGSREYRFSGNQIITLMGGNRAELQKLIKEIRQDTPVFYNELIERVNAEVQNGA